MIGYRLAGYNASVFHDFW